MVSNDHFSTSWEVEEHKDRFFDILHFSLCICSKDQVFQERLGILEMVCLLSIHLPGLFFFLFLIMVSNQARLRVLAEKKYIALGHYKLFFCLPLTICCKKNRLGFVWEYISAWRNSKWKCMSFWQESYSRKEFAEPTLFWDSFFCPSFGDLFFKVHVSFSLLL